MSIDLPDTPMEERHRQNRAKWERRIALWCIFVVMLNLPLLLVGHGFDAMVSGLWLFAAGFLFGWFILAR